MRGYWKTRWIPPNSTPIEEEGIGVVYVYPFKQKYGAIAYAGKANKPSWHHTFKTDAQLDKFIEDWFRNLRGHAELVKQRRAESYRGHNFKAGDIVTNSWGYDQTNVDWYRVTKTTDHYIWLKPVAGHLVKDEGVGPMSGYESLALDENLNPIDLDKPETKHRASGSSCSMKFGSGSKWNGEKEYSSWYA